MSQTIFEKSQEGQHAYNLPQEARAWINFAPPTHLLRKSVLPLPELGEIDLTRHFVGLSHRNVGIDNQFYPLGSCTMKLNPRVNELCAALPGFTRLHPFSPDEMAQGSLRIIEELLEFLITLTGMSAGTLLPNAGAQGELTGIKMIAAYHQSRGDKKRKQFLVPDSAHGTNPATVAMAGFKMRAVKTDIHGDLDLASLKEAISEETAGLMLTNPNTLGLFSSQISTITDLVHKGGGLLYYDGANLNPILTIAKPGEMGFDVMHLNLHKTFSTPHGGGGPGSGPVLCNEVLCPFLPVPKVKSGKILWKDPISIGSISSFHGNFGIYLRAYVYAKLHGFYGLRRVAENAVLNANYLKKKLGSLFTIPYAQACMHEFVLQADRFKDIKALDIAKRLLDYGMHAPTIYFPLIVKECMLIEPTETESKRTLDQFVAALTSIVQEIESNPELVKSAPHTTPVARLDEVQAARHPILIDQLVKIRVVDK